MNEVDQNFISLYPKEIVSKKFCRPGYHAFLMWTPRYEARNVQLPERDRVIISFQFTKNTLKF